MQGEAAAEDPPLWPALTSSDRQVLAQAVSFVSSARNVTWFPAYGCALLALTPRDEEHIQAAADEITAGLVGLDEWSFRVHRYLPWRGPSSGPSQSSTQHRVNGFVELWYANKPLPLIQRAIYSPARLDACTM
jgi:hypothetical protein